MVMMGDSLSPFFRMLVKFVGGKGTGGEQLGSWGGCFYVIDPGILGCDGRRIGCCLRCFEIATEFTSI